MKRYIKYLLAVLLLTVFCSREPAQQSGSLRVATWNLEHFPHSGDTTFNKVLDIIREYQFDILAIQELSSVSSFYRLLDSLPDYQGDYTSDGYLRTAFIYKTGDGNLIVEDVNRLEISIEPRAPLIARFSTSGGEDFTVINIHLKADDSGTDDEELREEAIGSLKSYMDSLRHHSNQSNFIVLGDWNDLIDDPFDENVYSPLLLDSLNYLFLTETLARGCPVSPFNCTCVGDADSLEWKFYDHILISKGLFDNYIDNSVEVLCLDVYDSTYVEYVSNHRPVVAEFELDYNR